jgi:hypothetical protein
MEGGTKISIVFCPQESRGICPIHRMWEIMHVKINEPNYKLKIARSYTGFIDAFHNLISSELEIPDRKFLLGHGDLEEMGFKIINGSTTKGEWWKKSNEPYLVGIFHCCNGSIILSDQSWQGRYKEWVSYNEAIYFLQGIPEAEEVWMNIFLQMISLLNSALTGEELKLAYIGIYKKSLRELRINPLKEGTLLVRDIINIALRSITCKQTSDEK